jgi:hypothetical protein
MLVDLADNVCLDRALECCEKFAVRNVVVQAAPQIVADIVNELFACLLNQDRVGMQFELFVHVSVMRASS